MSEHPRSALGNVPFRSIILSALPVKRLYYNCPFIQTGMSGHPNSAHKKTASHEAVYIRF